MDYKTNVKGQMTALELYLIKDPEFELFIRDSYFIRR
jgi:hypothetical protein